VEDQRVVVGGGGWSWNWLRDRGKQNEFFFLQKRRFLKENCNFLVTGGKLKEQIQKK